MDRTRLLIAVLAVCVLAVRVGSTASGKILYVDDNATGANHGSSWTDAFCYLQDALTMAEKGDEIRVAQGTYLPTQATITSPPGGHGHGAAAIAGGRASASDDADRTKSFFLKSGVTVKGGYAGLADNDPDARDITRYQTVLSGDLKGDDAPVDDARELLDAPRRADNSFSVVAAGSVDSAAVLDGFVITGGNRDDCWGSNCGGGGLSMAYSSATIENCTFIRNSANEGGAVHVLEGDPLIRSCAFISNAAYFLGGSVRLEESNAALVDCDFRANHAGSGGGVTSRFSGASFSDCTFRENTALSAGALQHHFGSVSLTRCVFANNTAVAVPDNLSYSGFGGALLVESRSPEEADITYCVFENNMASFGGAISASRGSVVLANCHFTGNVASNRGGALYDVAQGSLAMNCLFTGNRANEGGVLSSRCTGPSMINCTFADNAATSGQLLAWSPCRPGHSPGYPFTMTFANCILWDGPDQIVHRDSEQLDITVTYSSVFGGWPGPGNVDVDPCFAEPGHWDLKGTPESPSDDFWEWVDGDYHLKSQAGRWDPIGQTWVLDEVTSPCIDAGDPTSEVGDEPLPNGGRVNMGAYGGTTEASRSGPLP